MRDWQVTALFILGMGGTTVLLIADLISVDVRPETYAIIGTVLATAFQAVKSSRTEDDQQ